jgi:hypothetical protein
MAPQASLAEACSPAQPGALVGSPAPRAPRGDEVVLAAPGLQNQIGEYNCFLNVIIQSLWHCRSFSTCFRSNAAFTSEGVGTAVFFFITFGT